MKEKPKDEAAIRRPKRLEATRDALSWSVKDLAALHWYAVMVRAQTEFAVEAILERSGFVAVVPVRRVWRRVNRYVKRKQEVKFPVLVRYVLLGFSADQLVRGVPPWHEVFRITMVQSVVGIDGYPRMMKGKLVAAFLDELGEVRAPRAQRHMRTHREFGEGDMVEIVEGPFNGQVVRVHAITGAEARVLLPLFGNAGTEVSVPLANLEIAD